MCIRTYAGTHYAGTYARMYGIPKLKANYFQLFSNFVFSYPHIIRNKRSMSIIVSSNLKVDKKYLTKRQVDEIEDLLAVPNPEYTAQARFGRFYKDVPAELTYLEDGGKYWILPKNFPIEDYCPGVTPIEKLCFGDREVSMYFKGVLRPYQDEYVKEIDYSGLFNYIMECPCGHGKTVLGLYQAAKYGYRTLILVPTNFLAEQWENACKVFIGGANVVRAKSSTKDLGYQDADIFIISFDLLQSRDSEDSIKQLPEDFFKCWGTVLLDEAHKVGAVTYHPIIDKLPCKARMALSATFRRHDGMERILEYDFGTRFKMPLRFAKAKFQPFLTGIDMGPLINIGPIMKTKTGSKFFPQFLRFLKDNNFEYTEIGGMIELIDDYKELTTCVEDAFEAKYLNMGQYMAFLRYCNKFKEFAITTSTALMDSYLCALSKRNRLLLVLTYRCILRGRYPLVLCKRKSTLYIFEKWLKARGVKTCLIVSETNDGTLLEYANSSECEVLLGINQLAKEGMDVARLDTLIIINPMKDMEQPIGRIIREYEDKFPALVLYPLDSFKTCQGIYFASRSITKNNADLMKPITYEQVLEII